MELFSVVIPTLDRSHTLRHTLRTCIEQDDDNFEILVSNNHSTDETREVIEEFRRLDSRVRYLEPERRMGMSTHFEFALDHVRDGFVMMLGSDDGLLPGCMPRARNYLSQFPDAAALHQGLAGNYWYPDIGKTPAGSIALYLDPATEMWSAPRAVADVALGLAQPWVLPTPYNMAWVRTSVFDEIARRSGARIHSSIPDLWLAVADAAVIDSYPHLSPPFALNGTSASSTGLAVTMPLGESERAEQFVRESEIPLHPKVVYSRSVHTLMLECLLRAKDTGLIPRDLPLAVDRFVARAYWEAVLNPWSEEDLRSNVELLGEQARVLGCADILRGSDQSTVAEWVESLDFPIDITPPGAFYVDARPFGVSNIHGAAHLAEEIWLSVGNAEDATDQLSRVYGQLRAVAQRQSGAATSGYQWGRPIRFAGAHPDVSDGHDAFGFAAPEGDGTWTVSSLMSLALNVITPRRDVLLEVEATPFISPPAVAEQRVRVTVNGHHVGDWHLTSDHPRPEPILIPAWVASANGRCVMEWGISDPVSPASIGLSSDPRNLGLFVSSICLTEVAQHQPE